MTEQRRSLIETFECEFCHKTLRSASGNRSFVLKEHFVENCVSIVPPVVRKPLSKVEMNPFKAKTDSERQTKPS